MPNTVFLKIHNWETSSPVESDHPLEKGDLVIVETAEGTESAIVESVKSSFDKQNLPNLPGETRPVRILRKANLKDLSIIKEHRKKEREALEICRKEVKSGNIPMKIVGAEYSFDGGNILFAFVADGRVDFRELVKSLSRTFQRSIRLHQIGARDEARASSGYGICGRELCCVKFKENLPSISSEMAKVQHIVRRGSERISGLCGRLMCCLAYEAEQYREMLEKLPSPGDEIETHEGKGIVKEVNALSGNIKVELSDKKIIIISSK
jgi:cell fate regulator YaaT (PSP1 superfamily)